MSTRNDAPGTRSIRLEVEVPGRPEQVWQAVATGPGITAWFVPAEVEERQGGTVTLDFGPGMGKDTAEVTVWEPPRRFVAEATGPDGRHFAGEWLVEAREGGTCVVRLIYSGFGAGADWDAEYNALEAGWRLFLYNLRLYLTHFPGQRCFPVLVTGMAGEPPAQAFQALLAALGLPPPVEGERVAVTAADAPPLAGTVARVADAMLTLLIDEPAPGTAFVVAETADGVTTSTSVYAYYFGDQAEAVAARDEPRWRAWMERHFPMRGAAAASGG
jgi:uncharacterized protein YndB with AHSA1/START domain